MPRASKALDAAKQLSRKVVAAAGGSADDADKPEKVTKAAAKSTKTTAKTAQAAKAAPAPKKAPPASAAAKKATSVAAKPTVAPPKAQKPAERAPKRLEGAGADKFFEEQRILLEEERVSYVAQAANLKAEADQLAQEMEPGDIQFDEESGEGATAAVDRERDLALSAQARVEVDEIDHALAKVANGSYGICEGCGQPIPRARLKALPHARLCIACKSGGLSRR